MWGLGLLRVPSVGACANLTYLNLDENPLLNR
jgi:hypothetical protein